MRHGLEGVNLYNPVEGKLDKIIDYFVDFYGEKYRDRIEDRLKNAIYIFTDRYSGDNDKSLVVQYFEYAKSKMIEAFEEKILVETGLHIEFLSQNIVKQMEILSSFKSKEFDDFEDKDFRFLKQFDIFSTCEAIKSCFNDEDKKKEVLTQFEKIENIFVDIFKTFNDAIKKEAKKFDRLDKNEVEKIELNYRKKCINLFAYALSKTFEIKPNKESKQVLVQRLPDMINYLSGKKIDKNKFNDILMLSERYKNASVDNVCEVLNACKRKWRIFQEEKIAEIYILKGNLGEKLADIENNLILGGDTVKSIKDYILIKNTKEIGFAVAGVRAQNPNKPISIMANNQYLRLSDDVIVHEMNHAVLTNASLENDVFTQKIGLSKLSIDIKKEEQIYSNGIYTGLNEAINEYISQKIVTKMHKDNFRIGYNYETEVVYRLAFPLIGEFIEENIDDLIEICMSDDITLIEKYFNKDDIENLAKIINDLFKLFQGERQEIVALLQNEIEEFAKRPDYNVFEVASQNEVKWSCLNQKYLNLVAKTKIILDKIKHCKIEKNDEIEMF